MTNPYAGQNPPEGQAKEISIEETDGPEGRHIADDAPVKVATGGDTLKSKPEPKPEKKSEPKPEKKSEPTEKADDK